MRVPMKGLIGGCVLVSVALCAPANPQERFDGERVPVRWELPEPPEVIYYLGAPATVAVGATVLPSGHVSDVVLLKTFWAAGEGNWPEVEQRYMDCVKQWRFRPGTRTSRVAVEFRYLPFPYGSPKDQFGVSRTSTTAFEIRYEAVVPISSHEVRSRAVVRMSSKCGA